MTTNTRVADDSGPQAPAEGAPSTDHDTVTAGGPSSPNTGMTTVDEPTEKVSTSFIIWMMIAYFGSAMALMVPMSYSLAVRIAALEPGHEEYLGYVTGTAQVVYLVCSPLIGIWSDRLRSRWGRRTPFIVLGVVLGMLGTVVIALAPGFIVVLLGWVIAMFGWSTSGQGVQNVMADRVPEAQRGRVSALTGVTSQIAPVIGIGIAYAMGGSMTLVYLAPALIGTLMVVLFPLLKREHSSVGMRHDGAVTVKSLVLSYGFNPRKHPDFGWNWLGRFVFFMGLYFNTSFGTFFYAQRLGIPVKDVAGVVASIGMIGVVAATIGAVAGGFLSDKLGRRRLFTLVGALLFVAGAVVEATAYQLSHLIVGMVLMQLAIAAFSSVDQAIVLAVLPSHADAGRYMAVVAFAQKIPSALAPLLAPSIILIGASGGVMNYTLLYLTGAVLALIGGLIIMFKVKSVR